MANQRNSGRGIDASSSWLVLGLLAAGIAGEAVAQSADAGDEDEEIVVVGVRASQQSAINRKREARTATDSIVADDVGSFPDRNVNEAISRVAGVALGRNEFGEGESVAVRGNGPDLTRVELDGIGVQSTTGLALNAQSGRSADLRELPAELIKSVDVVKGSTADMTEGSLGGTIQIETRTGLDFSEPYFTVRAGANRNSLGQEWMPDLNAVAARQFFDGRLGVIVSGNYTEIQNNGHSYETTTSNNRGYARLYDFDQSPEKTFEYNLDTLGTDAADVLFANSIYTPRTLLTRAASAQTKEECLVLFPLAAAAPAVQAQQILEHQTCLNQWNDATPSLIRNFMNEQTDERFAFDARLDYRVTDDLTVFAKGAVANRYVHDQNRSRTPISLFNANLNGTFVDTPAGYPRVRSVASNAPEGYFLYDGLNNLGNNAVTGNVLNVRPESIEVDANHNVTRMTLTNNSVGIDQIENIIDTKTEYAQMGAEYRGERLEIDAMAGLTRATSSRGDMRTARNSLYGDATLTLQPNGLWDIDLPDNYDDTNPANFVQLRAPPCIGGGTEPTTCIGQNAVAAGPNGPATPVYTVERMPRVTPGFSVSYSPALGESSEQIAKLDGAYKFDGLIPFITRIKAGVQYRHNELDRWGGGGYTVAGAIGTFGQPGYVPAIIVPTANVRGTLRACQPTEGSSAPGGLSCNYGFVPSTNPLNIRSGVDTLTPEELLALFARTLDESDGDFFEGLPDRGNLPPAWQGIRTDQLFAQLGASQFMNFGCLKTCMGSDGVMYDQPVTRVRETISNVYLMHDFEQPLPLGLLFNGNAGVRGVLVDVEGESLLTLTSIRTTPDFIPGDPNNPNGIITQSFSGNTKVVSSTEDWLPSVNLNLWGFDETVVLRVYGGKTVARPAMDRLIAGGTCTIDERALLDGSDDDIFGCTGRVGNPGLEPFTAWSYNASLEWYPNEDTLLSVTYGKLDVLIGNPIAVTRTSRPFEGSGAVDPGTGVSLGDFEFNVPTWENGPGYERDIWEFQAKTAFTFLPWLFKYTGADANYSILASAATTGQRDPLTGDVMPPPNESKYYVNASLWYDDGRLNARVTYQYRSESFSCITPCGGNNVDFNYPGEQWTNVRLVAPGYNPGVPRFIDETTYIDAKASYNVTPHVQVYVEGRNLNGEAQTVSTGEYVPFEDGSPKVMRLSYGGRRFMTGVRFQFGGTAE